MPLATRSRGPRLVLLLLGSVLLAGSAVAAPIIVEYEITGGQAGGSGFNSVPFLDHAQVSSGHVIVSLDCGASSCSATTGRAPETALALAAAQNLTEC